MGNSSTKQTNTISALDKVESVLVDVIEPNPVLDKLQELGFPQGIIQDIRKERLTSDKNRKLLEEIRKRGDLGYHNLQSSLEQCGQKQICTLLERTEKGDDTTDLQRELREKASYKDFKEALIRLYSVKESMIPASPLVEEFVVPLETLYVQPPMSAFIKPNAFGQGKTPSEKERISTYRKLFINEHTNAPYKNIYVEANAGSGKTSFSQKVAMTWCRAQNSNGSNVDDEDVFTLKCFDLLFLLHLRDFPAEDMCLLDDLILKFVSDNLPDKERFSKQFIARMLQNRTCLVVIDGLDEWVHPETCARTPEIPHNNYGENCTILFTTRPWKLSTIGLPTYMIDRHVEILELDDKTAKELKSNAVKILSENCGEKERDLTDFDRKVELVKLGDIRLIPYILLQLICIWFDGLDIGNSKCETYSNTVELTLARGLKKKNAPTLYTGNAESNSTIPGCMKHNTLCMRYVNLLLKLGKLAFHTLFLETKETSLVIETTTVLEFLTNEELEFCLKIGLLSQTKDKSTVSVKRYKVFFQHKTVQEFMAALYITSEWNNGTIQSTIFEFCSSLSSILEMENLFVFVCGMIPDVYTRIFGEIQKILDIDNIMRRYAFRTDMNKIDKRAIYSCQSMQMQCLQESMRNENRSHPFHLYVMLDNSLSLDFTALKTTINVSKGNVKSLLLSNEDDKIEAFLQSLDCSVFTSLEILRVEYCIPVRLADLLNESRTLKCLTLSLNELLFLNYITITALTRLTCLESLHLSKFRMSHSSLECLYAYISKTTTLTQLKMEGINCSNHEFMHEYRECDAILDLRSLNELKMLHLAWVPCKELCVNHTSLKALEFGPVWTTSDSAKLCQDLRGAPVLLSLKLNEISSCPLMIQPIPTLTQLQLTRIDMCDVIPSFSPEMTQLELVQLNSVNMSYAAWTKLLLSVGRLPHPVTVKLDKCRGPSEEKWRTIVNMIKATPTLSLFLDYKNDELGASLTMKNKTVVRNKKISKPI